MFKIETEEAFAKTFMSLQGKAVLDHILNISGLNKCIAYPPSLNSLALAWWEGRRSLAEDILKLTHKEEVYAN